MGMAASQARLLALTAQMHNIELKAQRIEAEKISLATQEDAAYEKYCEALDKTKIQIGVIGDAGKTQYIDANYNNVCTYNPDNVKQYCLINNRTGKLIVPEDVKQTYEDYQNDKYAFAWAMVDEEFTDCFCWDGEQEGDCVGIGLDDVDEDYADCVEEDGSTSLYMTEAERTALADYLDPDSENYDPVLAARYEALVDSEGSSSISERAALLAEFRDTIYSSKDPNYAALIFEQMILDKSDLPEDAEPLDDFEDMTWGSIKNKFEYYVNLWEKIKETGDCEVIDPQYASGDEGTEWFNNMVKSGMIVINMLDTSKKGAEWTETTIATSVGNNYLQEVQDEKDLKKAEVEYEHTLKIINRKDTKFDTELKNLETQETSLKTMIDGLKKVKDDNVERTFGIFS